MSKLPIWIDEAKFGLEWGHQAEGLFAYRSPRHRCWLDTEVNAEDLRRADDY